MHIEIPTTFYVPVRYEEDILNIKNTDSERQIVIVVSLPNQREPRWINDAKGMEKEAQAKGVTLKIEYSNFDSNEQAKQIEELIKQDADLEY